MKHGILGGVSSYIIQASESCKGQLMERKKDKEEGDRKRRQEKEKKEDGEERRGWKRKKKMEEQGDGGRRRRKKKDTALPDLRQTAENAEKRTADHSCAELSLTPLKREREVCVPDLRWGNFAPTPDTCMSF